MTTVTNRLRRALQPWVAGMFAVAAGLLAVLAAPDETAGRWRDAAVDRLLLTREPPDQSAVVVVAIDERSLAETGPWPWPRETLARLVEAVAEGVPRAVAVDILLEGADRTSPAAMARRLAEGGADGDLAARLAALPDPDERFAAALSSAPTALAFLLGGPDGGEPDPVPLLVRGAPPALAPWGAAGATLPLPAFRAEAAGLGAASLEGGVDGVVRSVPALAAVGETVAAGLAVEAIRLAEGGANLIVDAAAGSLKVGTAVLPLTRTADVRIAATGPDVWAGRTVSAADVLDGRTTADRFTERIVLIGGTAPALGGLRATAATPVAPSVQIQADAVAGILAGEVPHRPRSAAAIEAAVALLLAAAAAAFGAWASPLPAAAAGLVLAGLWAGGAAAALLRAGLILDPVGPAVAAGLGLVVAGTAASVAQRRAAAALRRRFEQHLPPAVVERLAARPGLVKLDGERREVTALFTDIEGFTAVTDRIGPVELVRLLDAYFEGVVAIVVAHGGMVDKIVGDAVHALFNAPVDLADHPARAVDAALAVVRYANDFRARPDAAAAGFGRTRIGIETGEVVIGDVGAGTKLDYTAHGAAVNTAARLEAANKELGSTICVGPVCRSRQPDRAFRPLGRVEIRGRGALDLFEPDA